MPDLEHMTLIELKNFAKEQNIKNISKLKNNFFVKIEIKEK